MTNPQHKPSAKKPRPTAAKEGKQVKARLMWADRLDGQTVGLCSRQHAVHPHKVLVIPADPASIEAMVEQMALAAYNLSSAGRKDMHGNRIRKTSMASWLKAWKGDEQRKEQCWLRPARIALASLNLTTK